ncbi:hypothetical protein [Litoribrevibacter albus]|uniref:Lipoprotein n=1 Tax=Litoribrevibacter albus TaxID=1473156 RepID=A0AA37W633_9GAMM|nr:hypothetical protein [Litoribrevibacter albus]GLQ31752.1 hypothetical protein GCM10007876_22310 [Litoribrevibacter albus]
MSKRAFKMPLFITLIVAFFLQLTACDQHKNNGSHKNNSNHTTSEQTPQNHSQASKSQSNVGSPVSESDVQVIEKEALLQPPEDNTSASPKTVAPKRTIDLTLPEDWDAGNETLIDVPENKVLPDLFTEKEKTKRVSLDGKVLKDEKNEDYIDSIEGAEVSVEVKL